MFLFVGLGNPGEKYEMTRHNAGFIFIDELRDYLGWAKYTIDDWKFENTFQAMVSYGRTGSDIKFIFLKPQTFMNLSGASVRKVAEKFKVNIEKELVLAHDDLDIKLGESKIQVGKSPKGHNGITSVESQLGRINFLRVRLGIEGRGDDRRIPGQDYVLQKFTEDEMATLKECCAETTKRIRSQLII